MDGIAPHQIGARDQLVIVETPIELVAVLEYNGMACRQWTKGCFPHDEMDRAPAALQRHIVIDLPLEVAVLAHPLGPDRFPELHRNTAALALPCFSQSSR